MSEMTKENQTLAAESCMTTADQVIKPLEDHPEGKAMLKRRLAMCIATLNVMRYESFTDRRNIVHIETTLEAIGLKFDDGYATAEGKLRAAGVLEDRRKDAT